MSKFFVTNNSELFQKIKKSVSSSEYQVAFEYAGDRVSALTTKKLVVDNMNGVRCHDGFAIVTGTMAWGDGDAINTTTLQKIHQTFIGDVNKIRESSIGNYAATIFKDNILYVFGETVGFYNIYYYRSEENWMISNSLYDIYLILEEKLSIDELCIAEATVQDGIMLDDTYFKEVKRLSGFNYLRIKSDSFEVVEEEKLFPIVTGSIEDKVERYRNLSQLYGARMSSAYGIPVISMTGGLDARMVMSSYLAAGVKPHLYYGTGNSFITNTFIQDKEIDKLFSEKFGLTFHDESWATPEPIDKYWDKYKELFGFYYDTYAGSGAIVESLKRNPCRLVTFGYCGELLRNLPWIESRENDSFTLKEYLTEFYLPEKVKQQVVDTENYEKHIWNKLLRICDHYHLDINHIANEDIFYLSLERRKSADSALVNFVNFMKYCSYSLGEYDILRAGRVTCQEAANSSFMLHCLNAMCPSVLDVPVFSHCTMRKFYRDSMCLESEIKSLPKKIILKKYIKSKLPRLVGIYLNIRGDKRKWRFKGDDRIYHYVLSLYDKYDTYNILHRDKFDDARRLINYVMKVYALRKVKNSQL